MPVPDHGPDDQSLHEEEDRRRHDEDAGVEIRDLAALTGNGLGGAASDHDGEHGQEDLRNARPSGPDVGHRVSSTGSFAAGPPGTAATASESLARPARGAARTGAII